MRASASLVAGETTVPIDLQATARDCGSLGRALAGAHSPSGFQRFREHRQATSWTGATVSRLPESRVSWTRPVRPFQWPPSSYHCCRSMSLTDLAPGIRRTATPGTACFVSEPEDECIRVRWGDELQYQAMLSLSPDGVESWPRGMGWQGNVSFPLPVGVPDATLSFGEHRIPIDLRGMVGDCSHIRLHGALPRVRCHTRLAALRRRRYDHYVRKRTA